MTSNIYLRLYIQNILAEIRTIAFLEAMHILARIVGGEPNYRNYGNHYENVHIRDVFTLTLTI